MDYVFLLCGFPISWCSKKQEIVALSTREAEYISTCHALQLISLLEEYRVGFEGTSPSIMLLLHM
ncbi:hypothetical protein Lalb_Chr18g0051111 [Lupinus albus]|uniref:Uncharacterized protein n=1 Tax=Lupinus albus TaxID=3870 RepID=A0A6A4P1Y9_LUPAL|nr:hypothetical protein Lalb_Chr18g0051111 [Lupinus albus]